MKQRTLLHTAHPHSLQSTSSPGLMGWRQWRTITLLVAVFAGALAALAWSMWTFYGQQSVSWLCLWAFDCVEISLVVAHALVSYFFYWYRMVRAGRALLCA